MAAEKSFWQEVWGKVLITVVAGSILAVLGWFYNWFPHIWAFLGMVWDWVWSVGGAVVGWAMVPHVVSGWALILMGIAVGYALLVLFSKIQKWRKRNEIPNPRKYVTDKMFGVQWRWTYWADMRISEIWACCIKDKTRLVATSDRNFAGEFIISLDCETCGASIAFGKGTVADIEQKVARQIERKIETKEYVQVLKEQQAAATLELTTATETAAEKK